MAGQRLRQHQPGSYSLLFHPSAVHLYNLLSTGQVILCVCVCVSGFVLSIESLENSNSHENFSNKLKFEYISGKISFQHFKHLILDV